MKTELINYSRIPIHSFHVRNNPGKVGVYSQFEIIREKERFISVHAIFHRWDNYFLSDYTNAKYFDSQQENCQYS
uniref:Uncharacterized protein n=1 Tax=Vitis vinifera TaxID=29760 RepID=F6HUG2_VITVI